MSKLESKIVGLALERVTPKQIATDLSVAIDDVYYVLRRARQNGTNIPKFVPHRSKAQGPQSKVTGGPETTPTLPQIGVPLRLHSLLISEATRLNKTPTDLAQLILEKGLLEGWARDARN